MNKTTNRLSEITTTLSTQNPEALDLVKAVENIEQFLSVECQFDELQEDIHDCTLEAFASYMDKNDQDKRLYNICYLSKRMMDLLRPFAQMMEQPEERRIAC